MFKQVGFIIVFILCCIIGYILAILDAGLGPNMIAMVWVAIIVFSYVFGYVKPSFAWLWALIISAFIFFYNFHRNPSMILIPLSFGGAYLGVLVKFLRKNIGI